MKLEDMVQKVEEMSDTSALVAKAPLTWGSEAMVVELTSEYGIPEGAKDAGFEYVAGRDDLIWLLRCLEKKKVSNRTKAEFVIHYAVVDAMPAWIDDIPDA